jgi:signal transduction histidine kinase/ActR/RegA family two-component response regulator
MDSFATDERIRMLYAHAPTVVLANLINCGLVAFSLWGRIDSAVLLTWVSAIAVTTLVRVGLWYAYRVRGRTGTVDAGRWGRRYILCATFSGLLWGGTAVLFIRPDDPVTLILVTFVIGGMAAGAVTALSSYLPAFYLYLAACILPLEVRLLTDGGVLHSAMGAMGLMYFTALVISARSFNAALTRAHDLTADKERLLATMDQEVRSRTKDLVETNVRLETEVAERKTAEAALEVARTEAEKSNQAKSRFLAAASHDLRQPLQSMFLFAHALYRHIADTRGRDELVKIERGLDVLKGLLDSLLDLSRLDINVIEPKIEAIPLQPMLDDLLASYRRVAASKSITLHGGPPCAVRVESDPTLLGRMVRNLVENAIRYTERGSITLTARPAGAVVRIAVEDTGIGIPADQLERIFEEFHQIGNPERDKGRGLGLGLSIVQHLSSILGHPVAVRSQLGRGSTFTIEVPLATAEAAEAAPPAAPQPVATGRRVMVIDDDPMVLLALGSVFETWGYTVTMAGSEREAVEQCPPDAPPQLVIADYRLRGGKVGTDAIRSVRAAVAAPIPGIVLTGETGNECVAAADSLGAMILHKPVTPNQLDFAVRHLFGDAHA